MTCQSCHKEIAAESYFCAWCNLCVAAPHRGTKAGVFVRWVALMLDPLLALALYGIAIVVAAQVSNRWRVLRPFCCRSRISSGFFCCYAKGERLANSFSGCKW